MLLQASAEATVGDAKVETEDGKVTANRLGGNLARSYTRPKSGRWRRSWRHYPRDQRAFINLLTDAKLAARPAHHLLRTLCGVG